ncbi:DUF2236 domain-containing protein [Paeniglutamicibacter antarcticus]|uniref:DUF2236 domain-containing protein n=1 Tax=Arthrobacter terrae TaxID=2935737 RepID=A0A931CR71_9MICC|nr:oxygenase MpaB family protein [Arthrobacter terrae]MBG0741060.1 DUF2236 domain-containing protein [Arthrobacter terrae]
MHPHSSLQKSQQRQQQASPENWQQTFRQMALFDLASDMELGFFLAYYRNFAIPSIAETLARNGEISDRPMKRSYDTGIVIYELIASGLDSDRGQQMISLLNRVHRHVPGTTEDFLYVLLTLLVVPIRWIRKHGWRQPTEMEIAAATRFFAGLGHRMHIDSVPGTFDEAAEFFDSYEVRNVAASIPGVALMDATVQVLQDRLPKPLRPVTRLMISAMLDDGRLTTALGLPRAYRWTRTALNAGLSLRNAIRRRRPLSKEPHFSPGSAGSSVYPHGYSSRDIGPINVMSGPTPAGHELR